MIPGHVAKYLGTRGIAGPWRITGLEGGGFRGAVVIPALAESENLFASLGALAQNSPEILSQFAVLIVVNHRADSVSEDKADNLRTLQRLSEAGTVPGSLRLGLIDAATEGRELPAKGGGVGLARKIGFDLALRYFDYEQGDPLLVALDADTLVRHDYLPALVSHFAVAEAGGAVLPFCHQQGDAPRQQRAIQRYELFLRGYVFGLSLARSPYAFHTVGSAMACTVGSYTRAGGMNIRVAGEDFYFLQQLHKTSGIGQVAGTVVYPSARASHRVPFGTGRSVGRLLADEEGAVLFYRPECFDILREWLALVAVDYGRTGQQLLTAADGISPHLRDYLAGAGFAEVWEKLCRNNNGPARLLPAFHGWFDGLKTMKLIHYLSSGPFPRCEPEEALPPLFRRAGLQPVREMEGQLTALRGMQIGENYHPSPEMSPRSCAIQVSR